MALLKNSALGVLACIMVSACAPSTMAPSITDADAVKEAQLQKEIAVTAENEKMQHLQNVARPILIANAELCEDKTAPYLGMVTQTQATTGKEYKDTLAALYGVGEWPTVTLITNKSPASKVMKIGDMVTHINGEELKSGKAGFDRMGKILDVMQGGESIDLVVLRDGVAGGVTLQTQKSCDYPVTLSNTDKVNAYADGKAIFITTGMMRFVESDEELALVIGHELAHNSRKHMEAKRGNAIVGGILGAVVTVATGVDVTRLGADIAAGAHSQGFENEADYVGMYHTARAGYNIDTAPSLWRRMGASNPAAIHLAGTSHPSTAKRFLSLEATAKEIAAKRASGQPLIPEERDPSSNNEPQEPKGLNN